jgi:hypothetical protein
MLAMQSDAGSAQLAPDSTRQSADTPSVHDAAGTISVQLGVIVDEALIRLRARESSQGGGALYVVRMWAGVLLGLEGRAEETRRWPITEH